MQHSTEQGVNGKRGRKQMLLQKKINPAIEFFGTLGATIHPESPDFSVS
jgi:hypothetical protein